MRLAGQICCVCKVSLPPEPNQKPGERYCDRCAPRRRVYMSFMHRDGWYCQFLEEDLKTSLPRTLTFATSAKILELAEHAGALRDLACWQAIEHGISVGRGGVWLMLTREQYAKLRGCRQSGFGSVYAVIMPRVLLNFDHYRDGTALF
jgi:hypothetical protein